MSLSPAQLLKLIDAGLSAEQLRVVAEVMAETGHERNANAERQARFRARRSASVIRNVTDNVTGSSPSSNGFPPDPLSLTTSLSPDAAGEARDPLGWPAVATDWADRLMTETGCADPRKDIWPRASAAVLVSWHEIDRWEWRDVVAGISAVMIRRPTGPPSTWKYFAKAIAQAKTDRTTKTPETQANERRNPNFKTAAERNQDSTISAFRSVFGGSSDGAPEPGDVARAS